MAARQRKRGPEIDQLTKALKAVPSGPRKDPLAALRASLSASNQGSALPGPRGPGGGPAPSYEYSTPSLAARAGVGALTGLGNFMQPLHVALTPFRGIVSGARELTDLMDTDPKTRASFRDWYKQTADFEYGFGTAFPMEGNLGRIIGLSGDILLDPLTYATFGGTVPLKMVGKAAAQGSIRKLGVKSVIGREGRQKLATHVDRLLQQQGMDLAQRQALIPQIAARGKSALYDSPAGRQMLEELGVVGPGVYFFGSRFKVPGSDVLGGMLEKGLTSTRLGLSNTRFISPLLRAATPAGVGRLSDFGPDAVRNIRNAAATGQQSVRIGSDEVGYTTIDTFLGLKILEWDDLRRGAVAGATQNWENPAINLLPRIRAFKEITGREVSEFIDGAGFANKNILDGTENLPQGAREELVAIAGEWKALTDRIYDEVVAESVGTGRQVGYIKEGYFPRRKTDEFAQWLEDNSERVLDDVLVAEEAQNYGPTRYANSLKFRALKEGSVWFGHPLKESDLTAAKLNELMMNPTEEALRVMRQRGIEPPKFPAFVTDTGDALIRYMRDMAEQVGTFRMAKAMGADPDYGRVLDQLPTTPGGQATISREIAEAAATYREAVEKFANDTQRLANGLESALHHASGDLDLALATLRQDLLTTEMVDDIAETVAEVLDDMTSQADSLRAAREAIEHYAPRNDAGEITGNYKNVAAAADALEERFGRLSQSVRDALTAVGEDPDGGARLANAIDELLEYHQEAAAFHRQNAAWSSVGNVLPAIDSMDELSPSALYSVILDYSRSSRAAAPDVLGMSEVAASRRRIDSPLVVYKRTSKGSVFEHRPGKPYATRRRLNSRQAAEQDAWSRRDALLTKQYRRIGQAVARAKARIKNPNQARETISEVYAKAFNGEDLTAEQAESIHDVFMYTLSRLHDVAIVNHQAVVYAGNRTSARALKTVTDSFAEFLAAISKRGPDDAVDTSFFRLDGYPPEVQKLFYAFRETAAARNAKGGKISAEALHTIQDALHFSSSYEQYWEMTRWMDPFGVVIGDDVIDQILAHNARGYALDAARAGDLERFDRVTSPGYGRRDDTGIFGNYFQVLVERQNLSEVMDELSYLNIGKGETVYTPPPGLTPVERARYKDEAEMLEALIRSTWEQTEAAYSLVTRADMRYEKLVDARNGSKDLLLDAIKGFFFPRGRTTGSWNPDVTMSEMENLFRSAFTNLEETQPFFAFTSKTFDEFWEQASGQIREDITLIGIIRDTFAIDVMLYDTPFDEFFPTLNALLRAGDNASAFSGNSTPRELRLALESRVRQQITEQFDSWWDQKINRARAIYLEHQEDALKAARRHTEARNRISELTAQAKRSAERGNVVEDTLPRPPADVQSNPRLKSLHDTLDFMQGQDDLYPFYKSQQNHVQALLALSPIRLSDGQTFLGMSQNQIDNFIADAIAGKTVRMPQVVREAAESGKSFQDYVRASVDEYLASPVAAGGLRDPAEHYKMVKQLNRSFGQSEAGKYLGRMNTIRGEIIKIASESRRSSPTSSVDSALANVRRSKEVNQNELDALLQASRLKVQEVARHRKEIVELLSLIERTSQLTAAVQAGDNIPMGLAQEILVQRELSRIVRARNTAGGVFGESYSFGDLPQSEIDAVRRKIAVENLFDSDVPLESMYPGFTAARGSLDKDSLARGSRETEAFGRIYWDFKRDVDSAVRNRAKFDFMEEVLRGDEYVVAYNNARNSLDRTLYDTPLSEKSFLQISEEIDALKKLHELQADTPQTLSRGGYRRAVREREAELRRRRPQPEDVAPEPVSAVPGDYTSYPLRSLVFDETGDLRPWVLADIRAGRTIRIKFELFEEDSGRLFSLFWRGLREQGYESVKAPPGSDAFGIRVFAPAQADTLRPTTRRFDADLSKGGRQEQFVPDEADAMDLVGSQYSGRESFPLRYEYVVGYSDDGQPILRSKVFYVNPFDLEDAAPGSALAKLVDDPGGFEGMTRAEKLEILQAIESRENIPRYFETTEPRNVPRSDVETPRPSGVVPARTTRTVRETAEPTPRATQPDPEDFVDPNDIPMDDGWTYEVVDEMVDIPMSQAEIAFDQAANAQRQITEQRIKELEKQLRDIDAYTRPLTGRQLAPEELQKWRQPFIDHKEAVEQFLKSIGRQDDTLDRLYMSFLESETAYLAAVDRLGPDAYDALQRGRLGELLRTLDQPIPAEPAGDPFVQALTSLGPGWAQLNETYFPNIAVTADLKSLWTKADYRRDPEYLRYLKKYLGEATKFHKAYAVATPGFHIRNTLANAFNLFILGVNFKNALEAEKIYRRWQTALKSGLTWEQFSKTIPAEQLENVTIARDAMLQSGGGIFSAAYKEAVGGNKLYDNKFTRWNYALGQRADDSVRFALAYDTAVKGGNTDAAQVLIKRFFFDYEDLSQVDKFLKEFIPFWLWTSRNLYSQMQNMWLNPKRYAQYQHFKRNFRDDNEYELASKNQFVKELGGFKLPFGDNMYLVPDLGFARAIQTPAEYADWPRTLNPFTPAVKLPFELLMNQTAFTGKPIRRGDSAGQQSLETLAHILRGGFAPANQAGRMFADGDDAINLNAVLSFLGSPVRKYDN